MLSKVVLATLLFYGFMEYAYMPLFTTSDNKREGEPINPILALTMNLAMFGSMSYAVKQWINLYCYATLLTQGDPQ